MKRQMHGTLSHVSARIESAFVHTAFSHARHAVSTFSIPSLLCTFERSFFTFRRLSFSLVQRSSCAHHRGAYTHISFLFPETASRAACTSGLPLSLFGELVCICHSIQRMRLRCECASVYIAWKLMYFCCCCFEIQSGARHQSRRSYSFPQKIYIV